MSLGLHPIVVVGVLLGLLVGCKAAAPAATAASSSSAAKESDASSSRKTTKKKQKKEEDVEEQDAAGKEEEEEEELEADKDRDWFAKSKSDGCGPYVAVETKSWQSTLTSDLPSNAKCAGAMVRPGAEGGYMIAVMDEDKKGDEFIILFERDDMIKDPPLNRPAGLAEHVVFNGKFRDKSVIYDREESAVTFLELPKKAGEPITVDVDVTFVDVDDKTKKFKVKGRISLTAEKPLF